MHLIQYKDYCLGDFPNKADINPIPVYYAHALFISNGGIKV